MAFCKFFSKKFYIKINKIKKNFSILFFPYKGWLGLLISILKMYRKNISYLFKRTRTCVIRRTLFLHKQNFLEKKNKQKGNKEYQFWVIFYFWTKLEHVLRFVWIEYASFLSDFSKSVVIFWTKLNRNNHHNHLIRTYWVSKKLFNKSFFAFVWKTFIKQHLLTKHK